MQSRFLYYREMFTETAHYKPNGPNENYLRSVPSGHDFFFVLHPGSTSGDRKSPNPIEFSRSLVRNMAGVKTTESPFLILSEFGPQPYELPPYNTAYENNLYNEALGKLNEKLRGNVDLSVDLLQGGQTAKMVKSAVDMVRYVKRFNVSELKKSYTALHQAYHKARRDGASPGAQALKEASRYTGGKWLEFQYGWKPTASTIYGACIELASALPPLLKVEGRSHSRTDINEGRPWYVDSGIYSEWKESSSKRVVIRCRFNFPAEATQLMGKFTSMNPVSIAWELTPFSFVADWFLDVGGYLRNLESALLYGSSFIDGYYTETILTNSSCLARGGYSGSPGFSVVYYLQGHTEFRAKRRTVLSSYPYPRPPRFEANLGSGRMLNAAALLSQLFRK